MHCSELNPCNCPLCGQPNACAMTRPAPPTGGKAPEPCWCTTVQFRAELLQKLPDAARGKACICQACALAPISPKKD